MGVLVVRDEVLMTMALNKSFQWNIGIGNVEFIAENRDVKADKPSVCSFTRRDRSTTRMLGGGENKIACTSHSHYSPAVRTSLLLNNDQVSVRHGELISPSNRGRAMPILYSLFE